MELSAREVVEGLIAKYGCLPTAPSGPLVDHFDALAVAQAIEREAERSSLVGWTKITLHMDLHDALKLAATLRKAG